MVQYLCCRALKLVLLLSLWQPSVVGNSFLSDTFLRKDQVQNVLEHQIAKTAECHTPPTGPIETTLCDYETVESVNKELHGNLKELVLMPFFKYFQVDLYRDCPFWDVPGSCKDIQCAITTVDEREVPEKWRAAALSKIEISSIEKRHELPGCYYRDSDFCFLDDNTEGDYFDLSLVPERFTGYAGPSSQGVWRAIYEENCFGLSEMNPRSAKSPALVSLHDSRTSVVRENGEPTDDQCLEKRVYYKVISGLHASISTHICYEYLNQSTGEWSPNLQCFVTKVASHPERLRYIYFNTVLLLRAVARLGPYLSAYDYCSTGTHEDDAETLSRLNRVIDIAKHVGKFDETALFRGENANVLKEEFKSHFRNVTRIMDCIGCDKCRLWGKVQTMGIATALKILFELDEKALDPHSNSNLLQRSEVVALVNTLHRFSESLEAVEDFRRIWANTGINDSEQLISEGEKAAASHPRPSPMAGHGRPESILDEARLHVTVFFEKCARSAEICTNLLLEILQRGIKGVASLFKTSGKENGPSNTNYVEL